MAKLATDFAVLTRICEFGRRLHQLHRLGGEDAIEREFNAVCRAIWGYTLDDFADDDLSAGDHAWLDHLTRESAVEFAADQGYDLRDHVHGGLVADWGFAWMILAEARGVLTPERRAAAWCPAWRADVVGVTIARGRGNESRRVLRLCKRPCRLASHNQVLYYMTTHSDEPYAMDSPSQVPTSIQKAFINFTLRAEK